jgi:thiol-disulfide isomerase/thioredoxin
MHAPPTLTLLARAYCHLCDEMRDALEPLAKRFGVRVDVRDVDADEALERRYGDRVPVLILGSPESGVELCHYTLDVQAVLRALNDP